MQLGKLFTKGPREGEPKCQLLALSWPNLSCALKAAIGIGKRTLSALAITARGAGSTCAFPQEGVVSPSASTMRTPVSSLFGAKLAADPGRRGRLSRATRLWSAAAA